MRAFIFVDAQNIKKGAKKSLGIIVDFLKLRSFLEEECEVQGYDLVECNYYDGVYPQWVDGHADPEIKALGKVKERVMRELRFLEEKGFRVTTNELRFEKGRFFQKGVDVKMALDVIMAVVKRECDLIIIVSGDEDFIPVVEAVKSMDRKIWLVSFGANISQRMIGMADRYIRLDYYKNRIKAH